MIVLYLMLGAGAAHAACGNCAAGDAPAAYTGSSCGGHALSVMGVLLCDVDAGGTGNTEMWAVTDYDGSSPNDISVWGTDSLATSFCCVCDDVGTVDVSFHGSPQSDNFSFQSGATLSGADGLMLGYGGGDTLTGSDNTAISEDLEGGDGADTIWGGDGADDLLGGNGVDTIHGQDGNDDIWGGSNGDTLNGNLGDDVIDCGEGDNTVSGGYGSDTVTCGSGIDDIELGDGADTAYAGGGNDTIRAGGGADTVYGEGGADTICGGGGTGDYLSGAYTTGGEVPNAVDIIWSPSTAVSPTGYCQSTDSCGDSSAHGTYLSGACTCTLTVTPGPC